MISEIMIIQVLFTIGLKVTQGTLVFINDFLMVNFEMIFEQSFSKKLFSANVTFMSKIIKMLI